MTRPDIYAAIDRERERQDATWPHDVAGNPQRAQYQFYAPHLLLLEKKTARLRALWYDADRERLRGELLKIAAIAVRAMEEVP